MNIEFIKNSDQFSKILELSHDKVVIILFYNKGNPQCKYARKALESLTMKHTLSIFCIVDIEHFDGNTQILGSLGNLPRIDFYYGSHQIGSYQGAEEKEIDQRINASQQYMMTQLNQRNQTQTIYNNPQQSNNNFNQMSPQYYNQLQSQILNTTMVRDPQLHKQLIQNPQMLNQMITQQYMKMQQQGMINNMQPQINTTPLINPPIANPINPQANLISQMQTMDSSNIVAPTFQQMQYMFKIWETMNQMGILKTSVQPKPLPAQSNSTISQTVGKELILPSGDKLIPLGDGKYGLIKKSNQ